LAKYISIFKGLIRIQGVLRCPMLYRIYTVGDDGHFLRVEEIDAPDDAKALALAKQRQNGLPLEVWDGARMVTRLDRAR
jgi:hypothetical protein